ncbi:SGNH/GDSL hydrolase family protein [Nocardioides sp.]|uniref:SGNH/GDSL hydrolase family protein n=1 Tax=Nocardioides sp. TaxID=35761 RepID=UPI0027270F54|nr:SGNH/GDSL hydrolase family protein [Nocardioides sp.]MDO9455944.1 SGNH/GDSL hydrolase family protein [Nocardioides sp.]
MTRYVALGSSMAAGPGIAPRAPGSPRLAMRSSRNYPTLLAEALDLDLVDVSYSGATTAHLLTDRQNGAPPQVEVLDGTETLVTITIGGNDVAYVPGLLVATLPTPVRWLPVVGPRLRHVLDPTARQVALAEVGASLRAVGLAVREKAPGARVVFVDYPTILPPAGRSAFPLRERYVDLGRRVAEQLERATAEAALASGCELVSAGAASRDHHAWSEDPWTVGATLPIPGRPLSYHPNAAGMRAVADLLETHLATTPTTP